MKKRALLIVFALAAVAAGAFYFLHRGRGTGATAVMLVGALPEDASAIEYVDLAAWRESPFFQSLLALAPNPQTDADYAAFVRETGFDYERDLDRVAIALVPRGAEKNFFAIAGGRFDENKIAAYALKTGTREMRGGHDVYTMSTGPASGSAKHVSFAFMSKDRIALTDGGELSTLFTSNRKGQNAAEMDERALRLSGSPGFVILHPEPATLALLAERIPGGWRSEQLAKMLASLRWLTIAARPDGQRLRLVAEGESLSEDSARQLAGVLDNLLLVARLALDDSKARQQMDPRTRSALLELLQSAEVSRVDRGETKCVRVIFECGPKFLEVLRNSAPRT
jgi:hypothetical protein